MRITIFIGSMGRRCRTALNYIVENGLLVNDSRVNLSLIIIALFLLKIMLSKYIEYISFILLKIVNPRLALFLRRITSLAFMLGSWVSFSSWLKQMNSFGLNSWIARFRKCMLCIYQSARLRNDIVSRIYRYTFQPE